MAKKFKFRFETVLKVRKIREEQQKKEFATAVSNMLNAKKKLDENTNMISERKIEMKSLQQGEVNMGDVLNMRRYMFALMTQNTKDHNGLLQAGQAMEKERHAMIEATQKRKVMDKLRDRDKDNHKTELNREEQMILDDIKTKPITAINNEDGAAGDVIVTLAALNTLALILTIVMGFAFGFLSEKKIEESLYIFRESGRALSNSDYAIFNEAKDTKAKLDELMAKEALVAGKTVVNNVYAEQDKLLKSREAKLAEWEQRLIKMKSDIDGEKTSVLSMRKEVREAIESFKRDRKAAESQAQSEGMKKSIKIFSKMDAGDIADILKEGEPSNPKSIARAALYIWKLPEALSGEVLQVMGAKWSRPIAEELIRLRRTYGNK